MTENLEQQSQVTAPPPSEQPAFAVPDAYKDRGWVEKVKSPDDLWKTLDNAQSLLGKRPAGIPANDAPQEEWDKFYQAARPESPDKYVLSDIEGLPEGLDLAPHKASAQKLMYEAGLTPKQADALWKQYIGLELGAAAKNQEEAAADLDKRYDETLTKTFGDKRETSEKVAQDMINDFVPEGLRENVKALVKDPEAMVGMIALANGLHAELERVKKEYGAEGKLPDGGDRPPAEDISETVAKLSKLRLSAEAQDFTKPGHKKAMDEIAALQAVVARHYNK